MDTENIECNQNNNGQIKLDDLSKDDIVEILWNAVNKACKQGVFNIEESYTIKILFDRLKILN
jgi:hypothetical protein